MKKVILFFMFTVFLASNICCTARDRDPSEKIEIRSGANLIWQQEMPEEKMNYRDAVNYCENLEYDGHADWRLPTISELRTIIRNCPATEPGGACKVTDECLVWDKCHSEDCRSCRNDEPGYFSPFNDTYWLWSSSQRMDTINISWVVKFYIGSVGNRHVSLKGNVRCVRELTSKS